MNPPSSQKILAGNWKMFKVRAQVEEFFQSVGLELVQSPVRKIIATSPLLLETAIDFSTGTGIEIFAQDCAWLNEGALTGASSAQQLRDIDVKGTIIGHSEQRQFFADTDERCMKKAEAALAAGLEVIYCVGESLAERKGEQTESVLKKQLSALIPVAQKHAGRIILAYEPVWAIGTGLVASTEQIQAAHSFLAAELKKAALNLSILYGGSVKPNNFSEISKVPFVAGALVGGASLDAKSFIELHKCLDS